jgi:adenylate cyclase
VRKAAAARSECRQPRAHARIAVLAFSSMGGSAEDEQFGNGIAEDILTALARFPGLYVIARNSSFRYRGKDVDIGQVGRELGTR